MTDENRDQIPWRRSSLCDNSGACVEMAVTGGRVLLRESDAPDSARLQFTRRQWSEFLAGVYRGEFDLGLSNVDLDKLEAVVIEVDPDVRSIVQVVFATGELGRIAHLACDNEQTLGDYIHDVVMAVVGEPKDKPAPELHYDQ